MTLAREGFDGVLADAGVAPDDVAYIATTGEGENVRFATGHFYSMTTHARGGVFLEPAARAVVDIGALNGRAIYVDERGKVLSYKMTSQCASGSGQFLENIARYLGVAVEEIGPLSQTSQTRRRSARSAPCWPRPTSSTWSAAASPRRTSSRAFTCRWPRASSSC
jgi:benzoyl-CoA reductase subunit D